MTGLFNVYNSLAAIAVGLVEGISIEGIIASLEKITGYPVGLSINGGNDYTVIVDYSHTPDSLENCLKTAKSLHGVELLRCLAAVGKEIELNDRSWGKWPADIRI